jgi:hypothetical protein
MLLFLAQEWFHTQNEVRVEFGGQTVPTQRPRNPGQRNPREKAKRPAGDPRARSEGFKKKGKDLDRVEGKIGREI